MVFLYINMKNIKDSQLFHKCILLFWSISWRKKKFKVLCYKRTREV